MAKKILRNHLTTLWHCDTLLFGQKRSITSSSYYDPDDPKTVGTKCLSSFHFCLSPSVCLSSFVCLSLSLSSLNCFSHCVDNSLHKTPSRKRVLDPRLRHLPYSKTLLSLCGWASKQERRYIVFLFIDFVNLGFFLTLEMEPNL